MDVEQLNAFRSRVEKLYPEQTKKLLSAKSDKEQIRIYNQLVDEGRKVIAKSIADLDHEVQRTNLDTLLQSISNKHDRKKVSKSFNSLKNILADSDSSQTSVIALKPELLNTLVNATGNTIEIEVQKLLDGVERLSKMTDDDAILISLQIVGFSSVAVGLVAGIYTFYQLVTLSGAFTVSCTLAGVVAASVTVVIAVAAFIVLSVLIPILYLMNKPAVCVVLLINELNGGDDLEGNKLTFVEDYNVHGKVGVITTPIPGAYPSPKGTYAYSGFYLTTKRDDALIGTQYGFKLSCDYNPKGLKTNTKKISFAFGVECPLAIGSNNCYCAFDISAHEAANKTDSEDKLSYKATNSDGISLSINCNSGSGSVAYYIARVYQSN